MRLTLADLVLQGMPEALATVAFCFALLGIRWRWQPMLVIAAGTLAIIYIVRLLHVGFGVHTLFAAIGLAFLITLLVRQPLRKALIAAIATLVTVGALEIGWTLAIMRLWNVDLTALRRNDVLWALAGLPHVAVLFLLAVFIARRRNAAVFARMGL
ncbi:MAG: hypothetical protein AB1776_05290 [Bacillota bacterium]|jgi:hypothetical protein